ncbi:MAG: VWA domain-containing protein [Candidatus Acidiferrales bacterium]
MRRFRKLALGSALGFLFGVILGISAKSLTQAIPPTSKKQIRVVANEVIAAVTTTDSRGEFVLDLSQADFHVSDDGTEQVIDHWDLGGDPLAIVFVIETSSRLRALAPVIHSMGSIFTETAMALDGEASVVTYDATVAIPQGFTQDHYLVEKAIAGVQFQAPGTNLYDAMAVAVRLLIALPPTRRRIVLIVGESEDSGSKAKLGQIVRDAERANIAIYAVGPSSAWADLRGNNAVAPLKLPRLPPITAGPAGVDPMGRPYFDLMAPAIWLLERGTNQIKERQLEIAAAATGGIHYRAIRDATMRRALDKIGGELHAQYIISYRPSSERSPGFHRLSVTVSRPGVSIRTRPGYYVIPRPD